MKSHPILHACLLLTIAIPGYAAPKPGKLKNGAVTSLKIASNAVTAPKIADAAVTESKIADGAVTQAKLGFNLNVSDVWDVDGNNISYSAGQVLINTATTASTQAPMILRAAVTNHFMRLENSDGSPGWEILNDNFGFDIAETNVVSGRLHIAPGGNVGIGTQSPSAKFEVAGEAKATVFTPTSDRNAKQDFTPVDSLDVLAKVVALPITEWQYKTLENSRHMGPVAQDFRAAFGLGSDDKGISTVDADGVALAAIQGLNELVEQKDAEISELEERLAELEERVNDLLK